MRFLRWATLASVASLLAACTHIETSPDRLATGAREALPGVSYSLPMLQYDLAITRTLVTCPTKVTLGGKEALDSSLGFEVEATAKGEYVPGEFYRVDYDKLSSWFKTSTFVLERHANGTLKSLNAAAVDQTGEVIKDVTKTGILVSSLGAGGPILAADAVAKNANVAGQAYLANNKGPRSKEWSALVEKFSAMVAAEEQGPVDKARNDLWQARSNKLASLVDASLVPRRIVQCQDSALAATAARASNRKNSKDKTKALVELNRTIANQVTMAGLKMLGTDERKALAGNFTEQEALVKALADLDEDLVEINKSLTIKTTKMWPERFDTSGSTLVALTGGQEEKLKGLLIDEDVQILDPVLFATKLEKLTQAERARLIAEYPIELAGFLDRFGTIKKQEAPKEPCVGAAASSGVSVKACAAEKLLVTVALVRDEPGRDDCATSDRASVEECLRRTTAAEQAKERAAATDKVKPDRGPAPPPRLQDPVVTQARDNTPDPGIFVRDAALARLVMCQADTCTLESKNLAKVDKVYAPQVGQLRFLPFQNGAFESNALTVVVREDGKLEKVEYKRDKAVAQALSATGADVAGQLRTEQKRLEQQAKDDITYARSERAAQRTEAAAIRTENAAILGQPAAEIQAQIDLLTKKAALRKAEVPETPDQYAAQNEEIARLNKDTAVLVARRLRQEAITAADKLGVSTDLD